ncbi:glycosyltransferase family 2 protein [Glacieibacterium megasporae]|uniref:glycosyltransferase family 2 protein n=1 Tax=Glacieibacterium megasporae TaxID=2835787 RepID=UPI001C1DF9DD|nr:glycosyltransferase [Polymorphobacter megasporae]UAJ10484.1 glycosyltransferase [Polymorphobacter megasporae]
MTPLLSLIIPTRERARTLVSTLATATAQASRDFEIVVSDNMSADNTREVVTAAAENDDRIRYLNSGARLSMCGNYEFALEQARGDYVVIIGDDDAVMPGGLDRLLARLRALSEPTIHMWPLHIYDWPVGELPAKVAYLAPVIPESTLDLKAKARDIVRRGAWKYYELPSPYHSAIPRAILSKIRDRTGRVFHSTQPDVFTAMAIPAYADQAINLGTTVTLNGRSAQSNGLGFVQRKARVNIDRFIAEYGDYRFHPTLATGVPAAANMIPDAVLLAVDLFPELYDGVDFDYSAMWAYVCRLGFMSHGEVVRSARRIAQAHDFSLPRFARFAALHQAAVIRRRLLNAATPLGGLAAAVPGTIDEFVKALAREPRPTPA